MAALSQPGRYSNHDALMILAHLFSEKEEEQAIKSKLFFISFIMHKGSLNGNQNEAFFSFCKKYS